MRITAVIAGGLALAGCDPFAGYTSCILVDCMPTTRATIEHNLNLLGGPHTFELTTPGYTSRCPLRVMLEGRQDCDENGFQEIEWTANTLSYFGFGGYYEAVEGSEPRFGPMIARVWRRDILLHETELVVAVHPIDDPNGPDCGHDHCVRFQAWGSFD